MLLSVQCLIARRNYSALPVDCLGTRQLERYIFATSKNENIRPQGRNACTQGMDFSTLIYSKLCSTKDVFDRSSIPTGEC